MEDYMKVGEIRQIYTGSKSYWRTRQTIDIAIFEQYVPSGPQFPTKTHVIQIVAFDPSLNKEAPHLFIQSLKLINFLKKRAEINDVYQEEMIPGEKYAQTQYVKYILNRIAIASDIALPAKVPFLQSEKFDGEVETSLEEDNDKEEKQQNFEIVLVTLAGDDEHEKIFTTERPEGLSSLPCMKHHRRTGSILNPVEFKRKLSFVRRSSLIINTDLLQADKLSDVSESALQVFDTIHKMVIQKKTVPNAHSIAKKRWQKAIHFVIIRIEVARTTAMLDALDARKRNFLNSPPATDQLLRSPNTAKGRKTSAAMIDEAILAAHLPHRDLVLPIEHEHFPPVHGGNHMRSPPTSARAVDDNTLTTTAGSTALRSNSLPGTGKMSVSKSVATIPSPSTTLLPQIVGTSKSPGRHA